MQTATEDCDIVILGDFRFPGGTSTATASEIRALSAAGYRIAMVPVATSFLTGNRRFHPDLAALIAAGAARVLSPNAPITAQLAILHHPQVFANFPARPWNITADKAVLVVHHPPTDAAGTANYDCATIDAILRQTVAEVEWAPVGPLVRRSFAHVADAPRLTARDWVNIIDPRSWATDRSETAGDKPVIGRVSRPDPLKWPDDPKVFHAAYPSAGDVKVRLLGYDAALDEIVEARPPNWEILAFGSRPVLPFLRSIDYFVYFHHPLWVEAFGRAIMEAIASGAIAILPRHFRPVFGDGAIYAEPAEVLELVRALHADPARRAAQIEAGHDMLATRYAPKRAVDRVHALIGPPVDRPLDLSPAEPKAPARALFFTSNGVGMGHLVRSLAVARRLRPRVEPTIVTLSRAAGVARNDGIHVEYLPFHRSLRMDHRDWNLALEAELIEMISFHAPDVLIFDGNVPYGGLLGAVKRFPGLGTIWQRRAMWAPGAGRNAIKQQHRFDAVIEPGEIASLLDQGLTRDYAGLTHHVGPIRYLRDGEALSRRKARAELEIDEDTTAILLQLGSGNNWTTGAPLTHAITRLARQPKTRVFHADWLISEAGQSLPAGVERLSLFPYARYLAAFDAAFATAGYNTYHENIDAGLPTVFVPNENPEQDQQVLRAQHAQVSGTGLIARASVPQEIGRAMHAILRPEVRTAITARCRRLPRANGADMAAGFVTELAMTRRPFRGIG